MEQQADQTLNDYRVWSDGHERSLYDEVCKRVVRPRDLEWLREDVSALRVKETSLEGELAQAGKQRSTAEDELKQARGVRELATRVREKFVQLVGAEADELRLEAERKEDVETEDSYAGRREHEQEHEHEQEQEQEQEDWEGARP